MKIVNFLGGLGNQMFAYAFYDWLRRNYPDEHIYGSYWNGSLMVHGGMELQRLFDIELPPECWAADMVSRGYRVLKNLHLTRWEKDDAFTKADIVLDGYWLDKRYYQGRDLKALFPFKPISLSVDNKRLLRLMMRPDAVGVHVRRGDYLDEKNYNDFGRFCTLAYYEKAFRLIKDRVKNPMFFVFSDDIGWCKEELALDNVVFVSGNDATTDFFLLSHCSHHIIANSTFSYWAAMLNDSKVGNVIYPRKWYVWDNPDIFPASWTAVEA